MQLQSSTFDPLTGGAELICRRGRGGLVALAVILWSAPAVWWAVGAPHLITLACALLAACVTPMLFGTWRNRGRVDNWTVAVSPERLWINMRSGDHRYGPDSVSVVSLDFSEVREAARYVREFTTPGSDGGTRHHKRVYLELRLFRAVSAEVREALERVRLEKLPTRSHLGGLVKVTARVTGTALEITDPTTLRVHWWGQDQSLKPRLSRVLQVLSGRVGLGDTVNAPAQDWQSMDAADFERYVVELSRSGQRVAAVAAVRHRLELSLTDAHQFVESLAAPARVSPVNTPT